MPFEAEIFQVHKNRTADWRRVIGLLCLIAWMGVMPFPGLGLQTGMASEKKGETGHGKTKEGGNTIKMDPLVVNLNEPSGRHYLKTTVILEVGKKEWVEEVKKQIPSIMDMMIMALSDKNLAELQTPSKQGGNPERTTGQSSKDPCWRHDQTYLF